MAFEFIKEPKGCAKIVGAVTFHTPDNPEQITGSVLQFPDGTFEIHSMLLPLKESNLKITFLEQQQKCTRHLAALLDTPAGHVRVELGIADVDQKEAKLHFYAIPENGSRIVF